MSPGELTTWEGTLTVAALDALLQRAQPATFLGQRPGDFVLARAAADTAAWPSGRCFHEDLEIRWWPSEGSPDRCVLILNRLPDGWAPPDTLTLRAHRLAAPPDPDVRYLCVGQYDEGPEGTHLWWETRYSRAFPYLDSAPPAGGEHGGRVVLRAVAYELEDGRSQHRLVRFEHATPEGAR